MLLRVENVVKRFKREDGVLFNALDHISFSLPINSTMGIIGENGAGKTTLIKCICNLISVDEGAIFINDINTEKNHSVISSNVSVLLEGARNLYNFLSVDYNLKYFGSLNRLSSQEIAVSSSKLLDSFNLQKYKNVPVNDLSLGTQRKVAIVVSLLKNPNLLILDEPTLGLDYASTVKLASVIRKLQTEKKMGIILISHDLSFISSLCQRILFIKNGKVSLDESVGMINKTQLYRIQLIRSEEAEKQLISSNISFEKDDSVLTFLLENSFERVNMFSKKEIISIEKVSNTLEAFVKNLMENANV